MHARSNWLDASLYAEGAIQIKTDRSASVTGSLHGAARGWDRVGARCYQGAPQGVLWRKSAAGRRL